MGVRHWVEGDAIFDVSLEPDRMINVPDAAPRAGLISREMYQDASAASARRYNDWFRAGEKFSVAEPPFWALLFYVCERRGYFCLVFVEDVVCMGSAYFISLMRGT